MSLVLPRSNVKLVTFFVAWWIMVMLGQELITWLTDRVAYRPVGGTLWFLGTVWWNYTAFLYVVANVRNTVLNEVANASPRDAGASLN